MPLKSAGTSSTQSPLAVGRWHATAAGRSAALAGQTAGSGQQGGDHRQHPRAQASGHGSPDRRGRRAAADAADPDPAAVTDGSRRGRACFYQVNGRREEIRQKSVIETLGGGVVGHSVGVGVGDVPVGVGSGVTESVGVGLGVAVSVGSPVGVSVGLGVAQGSGPVGGSDGAAVGVLGGGDAADVVGSAGCGPSAGAADGGAAEPAPPPEPGGVPARRGLLGGAGRREGEHGRRALARALPAGRPACGRRRRPAAGRWSAARRWRTRRPRPAPGRRSPTSGCS